MRPPKAGEPYQVCVHLAADWNDGELHYWRHPQQPAWLVLCPVCHAAHLSRESVEIKGEVFLLASTPTLDFPAAAHASPILFNPKTLSL